MRTSSPGGGDDLQILRRREKGEYLFDPPGQTLLAFQKKGPHRAFGESAAFVF
jgi:hypothetical protein